jgi:PhnB protein
MNAEPKVEPTVIPYILANGAARAIDFYRRVFGAEETGARFTDPAGKVGHAEITIGNSKIMLADEQPPEHRFAPIMFHLSVSDVDAVVAGALAAGATLSRPVADQPYGDRSGVVLDPFGHSWMVSQRIEDVSAAELQRRVGESYAIS